MDYDIAEKHWLEKDKESVHMAPDELRERIERFIGEHNTCALATAIITLVSRSSASKDVNKHNMIESKSLYSSF